MAIVSVSNLGLDAIGMLLSMRRGNARTGSEKRGSPTSVVGGSGGGEWCSLGRATDVRLKGGAIIGQRWRRQRFCAVERQEAGEETEEAEVEAIPGRPGELPSGESPKSSGVKQQQQQRTIGDKRAGRRNLWKFSHLTEEWASFTAPREKGDVRDVVLMSLSFAVLIYISQHLVHAYCALRNMYHNHF